MNRLCFLLKFLKPRFYSNQLTPDGFICKTIPEQLDSQVYIIYICIKYKFLENRFYRSWNGEIFEGESIGG